MLTESMTLPWLQIVLRLLSRTQIQKLCKLFNLCHECMYRGTIVLDIFFISPNTRSRCSMLFPCLPSPDGTPRRIQASGPTPPAPSRVARRRPSIAELWQGVKRTSVRITRRRSARCTTWRRSCGSRGSWLRRGCGSLG